MPNSKRPNRPKAQPKRSLKRSLLALLLGSKRPGTPSLSKPLSLFSPSLISILGACVVLGVAVVAFSSAATATPDIKSGIAGNKCLDDYQGNHNNGAFIDSYSCTGSAAQRWVLNSNGTITLYGKCLDVTGNRTASGTRVILYTCNGQANQRWTNTARHQLVSAASGKCLDVLGGRTVNGTPIQIWTCVGTVQQTWSITHFFPQVVPTPAPVSTPTPAPVVSHTPTPVSNPSSTPVATSKIQCGYRVNTWSSDAANVGYSVTNVASTNGNPASFSIKLNARTGTTEVVGYPSDQCLLYSAMPANLTSSYKTTPPASSSGLDYEFAYDIWLTTASAASSNQWNGDQELMIWTYNNGQRPAGSVRTKLADGSTVWSRSTNGSGTVSVVLPQNQTSGTVNITSLVSQLKSLGYVNSSFNGILDVEYGIEAPYGGGQTFTVNSFSVAD